MASPCLPIYLSPFTPSVVSQHLLTCPVCRLIQWSAVTSDYPSEPLYQVLILAVSVSAELLWTVADWAQRGGSGLGGARGGCVAEVLSLESVDGIEVCEEGSTVLDLY